VITFLIDENLSPSLVKTANAHGYLAFHVNHRGLSSFRDEQVLRYLLDEDLTLVTNNWDDFRPMLGRELVHPGAVILPNVRRERQIELFSIALAAIREDGLDMVNIALDVARNGAVTQYTWPSDDE
jgi:predicted nuclease of predicted toxin-antitoxin system